MYQLAEHNGVLQTIDQHEFTASFQHVYQTYTKVYTHHSYEVHVQELTCKNSLLNISRITFNFRQEIRAITGQRSPIWKFTVYMLWLKNVRLRSQTCKLPSCLQTLQLGCYNRQCRSVEQGKRAKIPSYCYINNPNIRNENN